MNPLSIVIDAPQDRLSTDALSLLVSGRDWDPTHWQDIWVDPVTNTAMLCPAPLYANWVSTNTGITTKWGLSDYGTLTDSGNWKTHAADQGGPFIQYLGPSGNTAGLTGIGPSVGINQPMVVEYFPQKGTNGKIEVLNFGWSNAGNGDTGPSFRVYSNGDMDLWLDNAIVGSYSGGGNSPDYFSQAMPVGTTLAGGAQSGQAYGYNRIMIIPCRDRELLVVSSGGASFCHIFQNLPEGVANQTITPAQNFWFYVPAPAMAILRIAPLQYAPTGFICGAASNWRVTPPSGSPTFRIYEALSDASGAVTASLVIPTTNPYGLANPVQIKLSLTGSASPHGTPFVYGAGAFYGAETEQTTGASVEILDYVLGFDLAVSDTIGGTKATVSLRSPNALQTAGVLQLATMCHRVMQVSDEVGMILNGVCEPPHTSAGFGFTTAATDLNQEIEFEVRDLWKLCEEYTFSDPVPLDGMTLADAYSLVATMIGLPSSMVQISASAASFTLPDTAASGGNWAFLCDIGDKGSEILDKLHQTYASTWFHGFRPNGASVPRLCLLDPADSTGLPSTPAVTLYASTAAAMAVGHSSETAYKAVFRSSKTQILEPEANDIVVIGRDPRGGKPIIAHTADTASQAVTTAPASRPANWLGSIRKFGWVDPAITTIAAAEYAAGLLKSRLTPARELIEFECEYLPGVWRGDLVQLQAADGSATVVRIKTFRGSFEHVGNFGSSSTPDAIWRPCTYVGEVGSLICPLDVHGATLRQIAVAWHQLKAISKQRIFDGGEIVARRPVLNQQEV